MSIYLSSPVSSLGAIAIRSEKRLKILGITSIEDLLFFFPYRYEDWTQVLPINSLTSGMSATVQGKIERIEARRTPWRSKQIVEANLIDKNGDSIVAAWFNSNFLIKTLMPGMEILISGKVDPYKGKLQFTHPVWERVTGMQATHTARIVPIYHLTSKFTQKMLRTIMAIALKKASAIPEFLPSSIRSKSGLISLNRAVRQIHFPKTWEARNEALNRLKFDELFILQLRSALARKQQSSLSSLSIPFNKKKTREFVQGLPFKLTQAQRKAAWEILKNIVKQTPMNRLLEGDVGSGKTAVAGIVSLNVILAGHQVGYLAPTSILASQHFLTFCDLFKDTPATIALITQGDIRIKFPISNFQFPKKNRSGGQIEKITKKQLSELIEKGEIDIAIGTHALLSESISLPRLALAIVDEQHRFGVKQRGALLRRSSQIKTQIDADSDFLYKDLTYSIRGVAFEVANSLGLGLKENVYQKALEEAFRQNKLNFEKEKSISVTYNKKRVGMFRPDFIIEDKVIVELKALPFISKVEERQMWSYLKGSKYKLTLLVNFGSKELEVKRVVDDTARDGVPKNQRSSASYPRKSALTPHFLSMTATPIPRSLALIAYGDLDVSILDEMPIGRAKIMTKIVRSELRREAYDLIKKELGKGHQAFIICPLIDPSDKLGVKSVRLESERLRREHFPKSTLEVLHGRMAAKKKDEVMRAFADGKIQVLVATPVVEVGIDVPNATIILIEGAERFGLAQLHQLRGRVGRSSYDSYCLLATDSESEEANMRLHALTQSSDGFKLAEKDLEMRGAGEVYGTQQSGFLDMLKVAKLTDVLMLKQSKEAVSRLLEMDPDLTRLPALKEKLTRFEQSVHFE